MIDVKYFGNFFSLFLNTLATDKIRISGIFHPGE